MTVLARAITYSTLFIAIVLVFLPAQVLSGAGVTRPTSFDAPQLAGTIIATAGAAVAIWCILTFALVGRGTPAPFDPPRRGATTRCSKPCRWGTAPFRAQP